MSGADDLDADTLAFAHRMFELAREGAAEELAAFLDAGAIRTSARRPPAKWRCCSSCPEMTALLQG